MDFFMTWLLVLVVTLSTDKLALNLIPGSAVRFFSSEELFRGMLKLAIITIKRN